MNWTVMIMGDLQFGSKDGCVYPSRIENLKEYLTTPNLRAVISAGDLTDHGYGKSLLCFKHPDNELLEYKEQFVKPIDEAGIELLMCHGNHDTYVPKPYIYKPVLRWLYQRYPDCTKFMNYRYSVCYKRTINGVDFISMGIYPKNLEWLKNHINATRPTIIFFHFNIVSSEPYGKWWKEEEKEAFYQVIKHCNVLALVHGHYHKSYTTFWKDIPVYNGSGPVPLFLKFKGNSLE
jgi:predicted phosphodiesterase